MYWARMVLGGADGLFWPEDGLLVVEFEPDVGEQACPSPVAVEEGMDFDGSVMEAGGLFDHGHAEGWPLVEVIEQGVHVGFDFVGLGADVELGCAEGACPCPDFAEHFFVEFLCPGDIELG